MGYNWVHPQVPRELASVIASLLSSTSESSQCSEEVPEDGKKANNTILRKDSGNYKLVSLT